MAEDVSWFTFFGCPKRVVLRHVLYIVDQRGVRQKSLVFVDLVDGIFERELRRTVFLILREDGTCNTTENGNINKPSKPELRKLDGPTTNEFSTPDFCVHWMQSTSSAILNVLALRIIFISFNLNCNHRTLARIHARDEFPISPRFYANVTSTPRYSQREWLLIKSKWLQVPRSSHEKWQLVRTRLHGGTRAIWNEVTFPLENIGCHDWFDRNRCTFRTFLWLPSPRPRPYNCMALIRRLTSWANVITGHRCRSATDERL